MSGTVSQVTLGTATLGIPYGIANPQKNLPIKKVRAILDFAWDAGITSFDTAPAYGNAESHIGNWARSRGVSPTLATKLPSLSGIPDAEANAMIVAHIERSLERLGTDYIDYYLTHDAVDFLRPAVVKSLERLAGDGKIGAFGPSVYEPDEVFAALDSGRPGTIQLPLNALDQRFVISGALDACHRAKITVFARSILLQGLIFMPPKRIPAPLKPHAGPVKEIQMIAARSGCSTASLALRFASHIPGVSSMVIGCYSVGQLEETLKEVAGEPLPKKVRLAIGEIARSASASLLDPRSWNS